MLSLRVVSTSEEFWASDVRSVIPSSPSHTVTFLLDGPLVTKASLVDVDSPPVGRGYFFPQSLLFDYSCSTLSQYSYSRHLQMPLSAVLSRMRSDVIWQSSETRGKLRELSVATWQRAEDDIIQSHKKENFQESILKA